MEIIRVWLIAFTLIFIIAVGWYCAQPITLGISRAINGTASVNASTQAQNTITIIEYVSFWFGPLFIVFVLLWAVISSARKDIMSTVYD